MKQLTFDGITITGDGMTVTARHAAGKTDSVNPRKFLSKLLCAEQTLLIS